MTIFKKIQELEQVNLFSKHDQIVNGIIESIDTKILVKGNQLPSVNQMVNELGFARKTIVKAYSELKDRGIVESRKRLGYFIANDATDQTVKVALVLYAFHAFQEKFYNTFRASLGNSIQLDIFFHHNNIEIFETILENINNQYGMYIIAPIEHPKSNHLLREIPTHKLLLVDRHINLGSEYSFVVQNFEVPAYKVLVELLPAIQRFNRFILFFKQKSDYPIGVLNAFNRFCKDYNIKGVIRSEYIPQTIQKNTVYFTINDTELWELLKDAKDKNLQIGQDIGVLSHNDSTVKEIICGGITTFSTDFNAMARQAANFVLNKEAVQMTIPSHLVRRISL